MPNIPADGPISFLWIAPQILTSISNILACQEEGGELEKCSDIFHSIKNVPVKPLNDIESHNEVDIFVLQ